MALGPFISYQPPSPCVWLAAPPRLTPEVLEEIAEVERQTVAAEELEHARFLSVLAQFAAKVPRTAWERLDDVG